MTGLILYPKSGCGPQDPNENPGLCALPKSDAETVLFPWSELLWVKAPVW